ncbi:hypothetical protein ACFYYM_08030 [Streptomyces erythrochromogenes]|uniref:hypothetical protein n=1 Tax=Streptomyces erythrochromogenes TaxID=285574 RepID=UPI0036D1AF4A
MNWSANSGFRVAGAGALFGQILDRALPSRHTGIPDSRVNRWCRRREAAQRAEAVLERDSGVRARLGDDAPDLNASAMHPRAWAARKVNTETQNKLGRKDVSERRCSGKPSRRTLPRPASHADGLPELAPHEALERLAALNVMARLVDAATVVTV